MNRTASFCQAFIFSFWHLLSKLYPPLQQILKWKWKIEGLDLNAFIIIIIIIKFKLSFPWYPIQCWGTSMSMEIAIQIDHRMLGKSISFFLLSMGTSFFSSAISFSSFSETNLLCLICCWLVCRRKLNIWLMEDLACSSISTARTFTPLNLIPGVVVNINVGKLHWIYVLSCWHLSPNHV